MKGRTLPLVIGAVSLVALAAVFGVSRATAATSMHGGSASPQGNSSCDRLMGDPAAMNAMQPLHAEHAEDLQAWRDRYGADPRSAESKAALKSMRREHVREMRAAFKKLGVKMPARVCSVGMMEGMDGAGMMDGGAGGMMSGSAATSDVHEQHHGEGSGSPGGSSTMMGGSASGMMGGTF